VLVGAILGVSIQPVQTQPIHEKSISSGTKYEITIGDQVLAAGLSADYTCTGTSDNVIWTSAIAALPAGGGIINDLTGGNYHFVATVNVPANVTIMGIGRSSSFSNNASTPIFTSTGNGTTYENISTDAGGITTGATTGWLEINVAVGTTLYTERSPNSSLVDGTANLTTLNAPTGRTASYVFATADALSSDKAQANQVLTGTADNVYVSAALTAGYKVIVFLGVTATFANTVTLLANGTIIQANGVKFNNNASTPLFADGGKTGCVFRDISTDAGGLTVNLANTTLQNVTLGSYFVGLSVPNSLSNTIFGQAVLQQNTTGYQNSAFGQGALYSNTTGNNNLGLGYYAGLYNTTISNQLFINTLDQGSYANDVSNSLIYGIFNASPSSQTLSLNAGIINMKYLPTSNPHVAGELWNSSGTLMVSGG
jgi:hypothetical protein